MELTTHPQVSTCQAVINLNGLAIKNSLAYMPNGTYRTFCAWVIEDSELAEQWLQLVGILGLVRLTEGLLDGLLSDDELQRIMPYSVPMNLSQMYEVISDNLAIGLGKPSERDTTHETRCQLLHAFNTIMIERLNGNMLSTRETLAPLPWMQQISCFEQSLSSEKHREIASAYLEANPDADPVELEYALYPSPIANVETCIDLVTAVAGLQSEPLVVEGLLQRYSGVNHLLENPDMDRETLIETGADTIMVMPTLAYYVGLIAEEIRPLPGYQSVLEDGTLHDPLQSAALLVRLLNDLGTGLLEQPDEVHRALVNYLRAEAGNFSTFDELLLAQNYTVLFTRLQKDIRFGEFNVCLYETRKAQSVEEALDTVYEQITYLSRLYRVTWQHLQDTLQVIDTRLNSHLIGNLITRFVRFHEMIYSQPFNEPCGEYAV